MSDKAISTTIEILGKPYTIKAPESAVKDLEEAAQYLDKQMSLVKESGKAINLERIAIITALNLAHQFLQLDQQKNNLVSHINQRILQLQDKVEDVLYSDQKIFDYPSENE